jgi:glycosyltransferase involved in cell wall biosynthesis
MKIAINALSAKSQHHGVGVYITNILKHLIPLTRHHDFLLYKRRGLGQIQNLQDKGNIKYKDIDMSRSLRIVWEQTFLPVYLSKEKFDLFWGPCNFLPLIKPCRFIVTIHDLAPFLLPRSLPLIRRIYYQRAFLNSIHRADKIVVVSESLKTDLIKHFSVPEKKIKAIHNGIDESFRPIVDKVSLSKIQKKYRLPSDFILTLGVLEPKKNTIGLIQAYADLKKSYTELPKLVIGGSKQYGWKNNQVFKIVKNLRLDDDIIFTDTIVHEDLPAVYTLATLFVLPSIYEGFGLPVAEAMACGTPVITSNTSSLPEVAGDAAILVNPFDVQEISRTISRVLANERLQKEMKENGIENAKRFSWNRAANALFEVIETLDK